MNDIRRWGRDDPANAIFKGWIYQYQLKSKYSVKQLADDHQIPLIYLEEAYEAQQEGPPKIVRNDWIYHKYNWGIVTKVSKSKKKIQFAMVQQKAYYDNSKRYEYPIFNKFARTRDPHTRTHMIPIINEVSAWECKKVGHDTPEWKKLRTKQVKDYNEDHVARKKIWNTSLKEHIAIRITSQGPHFWKELERIWFDKKLDVLNKGKWEKYDPRAGYDYPFIPESIDVLGISLMKHCPDRLLFLSKIILVDHILD